MSEPEMKKIRARDVVPYFWARWCSIAGGKPFANLIVNVRWTEDGTQLSFMLGTHNFFFADPDEELELVPKEPHEYHRTKPPFVLPPRPTPKPTLEAMTALLAARDAELERLKRQRQVLRRCACGEDLTHEPESFEVCALCHVRAERDTLKAELEAVRRERDRHEAAGRAYYAELEDERKAHAETRRQAEASIVRAQEAETEWQRKCEAAEAARRELRDALGREKEQHFRARDMLDRIAAVPEVDDRFHAPNEECVADGVEALAEALQEAERTAIERAHELVSARQSAERAREVVRQCKDALDFLFTPGPGIAVPEKYEHEHEVAHAAWNRKLERLEDARSAATTLLGEGDR